MGQGGGGTRSRQRAHSLSTRPAHFGALSRSWSRVDAHTATVTAHTEGTSGWGDDVVIVKPIEEATMSTPTTYPVRNTDPLAIPGHLARYVEEVETWRLEALAYRAAQLVAEAHR
jgi:hypothetical protein